MEALNLGKSPHEETKNKRHAGTERGSRNRRRRRTHGDLQQKRSADSAEPRFWHEFPD
ncbi:hypothetical protein ED733_003642 [Metarhizium rileyi]|uniref:Uncharacterized protein n=1 Tax=Metarhizium rileyi (strain RCEF 4871) TaxID=1649241 RepID=A0A5C6G456_METRR|nr:hypothetical protein ED733_003642 [Metarhizium rileyi]